MKKPFHGPVGQNGIELLRNGGLIRLLPCVTRKRGASGCSPELLLLFLSSQSLN